EGAEPQEHGSPPVGRQAQRPAVGAGELEVGRRGAGRDADGGQGALHVGEEVLRAEVVEVVLVRRDPLGGSGRGALQAVHVPPPPVRLCPDPTGVQRGTDTDPPRVRADGEGAAWRSIRPRSSTRARDWATWTSAPTPWWGPTWSSGTASSWARTPSSRRTPSAARARASPPPPC